MPVWPQQRIWRNNLYLRLIIQLLLILLKVHRHNSCTGFSKTTYMKAVLTDTANDYVFRHTVHFFGVHSRFMSLLFPNV